MGCHETQQGDSLSLVVSNVFLSKLNYYPMQAVLSLSSSLQTLLLCALTKYLSVTKLRNLLGIVNISGDCRWYSSQITGQLCSSFDFDFCEVSLETDIGDMQLNMGHCATFTYNMTYWKITYFMGLFDLSCLYDFFFWKCDAHTDDVQNIRCNITFLSEDCVCVYFCQRQTNPLLSATKSF